MSGITYYGGLHPHGVIGGEKFAIHDPTSTWDDGGVARDVLADEIDAAVAKLKDDLTARLSEDVQIYGAHQVRDGVHEYVTKSYADIAMIDGHLCIAIDFSNEEAELRAYWSLEQLLTRAVSEAKGKGDSKVARAVEDLGAAFAPDIGQRAVGVGGLLGGDSILQRVAPKRSGRIGQDRARA